MHIVEHLIAGRWSAGGDVSTVIGPHAGAPVANFPAATPHEVAAAVAGARAAQPDWAATAPAARADALRAAATAVEQATVELARTMSAEMGKPEADAAGSIAAGVGTLRQYAELGQLHGGRTLAGDLGATDLMVREPRGVVAAITPWNDPVAISCGLLGAALVTGNAAVSKPSERTPATGWLLTRTLAPHFPPGVLSMLAGGAPTGAALAESAVDVVAHVGSTATGRAIAAAAARTGAKALLENGGCDPLIIDTGVDPAWAAQQAALGAFANAGQICVAVERIYVHADVAEEFLAALVKEAAAFEIGPLVDLRHRSAVHGQVVDAVDRGARILTGGTIPEGPGAWYPPTVLTDCTDEMRVVETETFGPVAPVVTVASFDEALSRATRSPYGLAATVLTPSMSNAHRAWRQLETGTVKINAVFGGAPGGAAHPRRGSGQGFGYGPELLDEMTATKVVHLESPPGGW
ncbi:aldehyde dehydrogenase family protein [Dactylosporangium vinaceum]|uniref:Aldehyde dehydrogenase family protein n=1 Tax=Dactylosporangium vinaceum TaxID=53362 RepID=A0ABV5MEL7_9ACTN|nr:aldehyde dehydrogenase family protein [Dactylosporangium vinaceum]UAB92364.1 aldehyde dehydrogenase family protein [Dactylosporangium vinaceum]